MKLALTRISATALSLGPSLALFCTPAQAMDTFFDVTAAAGIEIYTNAGWGSGVAWADFDNDGDLDLFMVDGPGDPARVWRNDGGGSFTDVAAAVGIVDTGWGKAFVPADYDNDGDVDVLMTNYDTQQTNRLWRNDGGTFTDVTVGSGFDWADQATGACWADFDGDRDLDCYITTYGFTHRNRFMRNDGNDQFTDIAQSLVMQDQTGWGYQPGWFDYDNDGDLDLYVGNDNFFGGTGNKLYRNEGNGTFTDVSVASGANLAMSSMGLGIGDYDNDGDLDVYISNIHTGNKLLRNNGDGTFTESAVGAGVSVYQICWGVDFLDMDHDTYLDIYACAFGESMLDPTGTENWIFHNNGDGTFTDISVQSGADNAGISYCSAWGDYDEDGDLDIVMTNWWDGDPEDLPCALYQNDHIPVGGSATDWLQIDLVGTVSNRDAIGARVQITTSEGTYIREKQSGTSYLSSAQPALHFGLGTATEVQTLVVNWPSGGTSTLTNVAGGQKIQIVEPGEDPSSVVPVGAQGLGLESQPNPFRDGVRFALIGSDRDVEFQIFDAEGRAVRRLGAGTTVWDGQDALGNSVPAGIYWVKATRGGEVVASDRIVRVR
ncbi:MAG: FG-GAP-like repeat-containing protein [Candidatus Eisenbacteria bacterium]